MAGMENKNAADYGILNAADYGKLSAEIYGKVLAGYNIAEMCSNTYFSTR